MAQSPDDLVEVGTYANEFAAGVIRAKLEEAGLQAQVIAANQAAIGVFGLARWLPYTVWVRRVDQDAARATLEAVRAEQGTVDWDGVDVGEPEDALAARIEAGGRAVSHHTRLRFAGALLIASVVCIEALPGGWMVGTLLLLIASLLAVSGFLRTRSER